VRLHGVSQERDAVGEVVLPERGVPLSERIAAPYVVDEDVESAVAVGDALDQRPDLLGFGVIDANRDAGAADFVDEMCGVLGPSM
jgi:hypothetical protein